MRALASAVLVHFFVLASSVAASDDALRREIEDQAHQATVSALQYGPLAVRTMTSHYWLIISAAGSVQGSAGTFFKSDLMLSNHRAVSQNVDVSFYPQGLDAAGNLVRQSVTVPPNSMLSLDDVVLKTLHTSGLGMLDVRARTTSGGLDTDAKIDAFSRIWTPQANAAGTRFEGGTTSQSFPSAYIGSVTGSNAAFVLGLQQDDRFRSNIGIFNHDLFNSRTWTVQVTGTRGQTTFTITVPQWSMVQAGVPPGIFGSFYATVTPEAAMTDWWAVYGSSVDNLTGDGWVSMGSQNQ